KPLTTDAMVSHVDFLPTLASLAGTPKAARSNWQGKDYSQLVLQPKKSKTVQDYVVFTYDDVQSGQKSGPYPKAPNHIVSIREERWKLAKYYAVEPKKPTPPQWEMYDLKEDPEETENLAYKHYKRSPLQEREYQRLKKKLAAVEKTRLKSPKTS
ncbi:MAG TPA: sulfatase/phosphatase domain-containing protein, partial [Solirubrobacterales bacterium]|nr:sulfatase/phosphatase domain-containing protein [Solirubrobacterales bacterium]